MGRNFKFKRNISRLIIYFLIKFFKGKLHSHSCIIKENKMYLYGGKSGIFTNSNKLYCYYFEENK